MTLRVGVLMDDIRTIKPYKDSTFAMLLEAQRRGHEVLYMTQASLCVRNAQPFANITPITVNDHEQHWFSAAASSWQSLLKLDIILARKDPPFDSQFLYDTFVLDLAAQAGVIVVNHPQALRNANEKMYTQQFPQCIPPTCVARDITRLREFASEVGEVVLKPLDGMAGRSIFKSHANDPNLNVILETLTADGTQLAMAQRFIPEASLGDKRILFINGEAIPYALARIPQGTDFRGNIARGGKAIGQPLSDHDRWICSQLGSEFKKAGLLFVGIDVIGDYLTEINVTSPTGIRELDAQFGICISSLLFDCLEKLHETNN